MNCCNDYGQCQGGPGCPAAKPIRTIKPYPVVPPDFDDNDHQPGGLLADMIAGFVQAVLLVAACLMLAAILVGLT